MKWSLLKQPNGNTYDLYDGETCIGEIKSDRETARLIVAAPLLLQACKWAFGHLEFSSGDGKDVQAILKNAIQEARSVS